VVRAVNAMLDEVQSRTGALEQSNAALTDEVELRQAAETALARASAPLESSPAAAEIGGWFWHLHANEVLADRNLASLYGVSHERGLAVRPWYIAALCTRKTYRPSLPQSRRPFWTATSLPLDRHGMLGLAFLLAAASRMALLS
jgi:hypothetical protein